MNNKNPKVTFMIPTLNADKYLERCLSSIHNQENKDMIEIIVVDGGSTDRTIELANKYGCAIFHDTALPEQRLINTQEKAKGEFIVFMSADNELACNDWVTKMLKPLENENVYGVFTPIVDSYEEKPFTRYINLMQRDPFTWYVIGKVNPRNVTKKFPVLIETDDYVVFNYTTEKFDFIAFHYQAFVVRKKYVQQEDIPMDDIMAIIDMIKKGHKIAYVKNACIHHHHICSFMHFVRRFNILIPDRIKKPHGWISRQRFLSKKMKIRQYTWFLYSLTFIGPSLDMIMGFWKDRSIYWLYHPLACFALSYIVLINYFAIISNRFLNIKKLISFK